MGNINVNLSPKAFISILRKAGIKRFYVITDPNNKNIIASHPILQPLADFLMADMRDYSQHEGLFFELSDTYDTIHAAFIHKTKRGQGAGGVRYWHYDSMEDFLRDGMRLAKGMGRKNALAGLWWGGAKGVMTFDPQIDKNDPKTRETLYKEYGAFITSLNGVYVTAEDVGTTVTDMNNIFLNTRFTTCIHPEKGGSGNPSIPTARGVVSGIEAALKFRENSKLAGKTIAVQGLGNVGRPFIQFAFEKGASKIIGADIFSESVEAARKQFEGYPFEARLVAPNDNSILFEHCDIVAPCATGAVLNPETIPHIQAKIICGAANNQLADALRDDQALFEKGILYIPDFLTNRMGIVNCANEQYGRIDNDPIIWQHLEQDYEFGVYQTALRVLNISKNENVPTGAIALKEADRLSEDMHPIFGHRGQAIIDDLVKGGWEI